MPSLKDIDEVRILINLFNRYRTMRDIFIELDRYITEFNKNDINQIRIAAQRRDLGKLKQLLKETKIKYHANLLRKIEGPFTLSIKDILRTSYNFRGLNKKHIIPRTKPIKVKQVGNSYKLIEGKEIVYAAVKLGQTTVQAELC